MQSGAVLDAEHEHTASGTPIVSYVRTGRNNQSWDLEFPDQSVSARFRGVGSNRCIGSDQNTSLGAQLSLYDCADDASQRWDLESLGNNQWAFHSQLRPWLCMNIRGGQTDPTQAKEVILWWCENTPNERFTLTVADASTGYDPSSTPPDDGYGAGPPSLVNLGTGGGKGG